MNCPSMLPVVRQERLLEYRAYREGCHRFLELHCCGLQKSQLVLINAACSCGAVLLVTTAWCVS